MKSLKVSAVALILLSATLFTGCTAMSYMTPANTSTVGYETSYYNPQWAPPYYPGVRYYYLPDIECYYDLASDEFVYLYEGQWNYSRNIPYMYSNFRLDNCFTVVLNSEVYRPWLHHQYYVSHYPRYYYRDYYDHSNIPYVRGFNENRRSAIYWGENERHRARQWDDRNMKYDRRFKYQKEDRAKQKEYNSKNKGNYSDEYDRNDNRDIDRNDNNTIDRNDNRDADRNVNTRTQRERENAAKDAAAKAEKTRVERERVDATEARAKENTRTNRTATETGTSTRSTRQTETKTNETDKTQNTNYYGRTIGNPVKVEKQMQVKTEKTENTTERVPQKTTTRRR